jgi:hypothetical protein
MRSIALMAGVGLVLAVAGTAGALTVSLPDGTVQANTYYAGSGLNAYWAESVVPLNLSGNWVSEVSGKITAISNPTTSWVEIGVIPKNRYDYWQTAFGGGWKPAVFDKGLYVVSWDGGGGQYGLSLNEGWDDWTSTTYHNKNGGNAPFAWPLAAPSGSAPWDFAYTMEPTTPGNSYLSVTGETIYGTQPFPYGITDGQPVANDNDYTDAYLIAQIWTDTQGASFTFEDVQATVVPEPVTMAGLVFGLGGLATYVRRRTSRR